MIEGAQPESLWGELLLLDAIVCYYLNRAQVSTLRNVNQHELLQSAVKNVIHRKFPDQNEFLFDDVCIEPTSIPAQWSSYELWVPDAARRPHKIMTFEKMNRVLRACDLRQQISLVELLNHTVRRIWFAESTVKSTAPFKLTFNLQDESMELSRSSGNQIGPGNSFPHDEAILASAVGIERAASLLLMPDPISKESMHVLPPFGIRKMRVEDFHHMQDRMAALTDKMQRIEGSLGMLVKSISVGRRVEERSYRPFDPRHAYDETRGYATVHSEFSSSAHMSWVHDVDQPRYPPPPPPPHSTADDSWGRQSSNTTRGRDPAGSDSDITSQAWKQRRASSAWEEETSHDADTGAHIFRERHRPTTEEAHTLKEGHGPAGVAVVSQRMHTTGRPYWG